MAGLCEGGNEPTGSLKANSSPNSAYTVESRPPSHSIECAPCTMAVDSIYVNMYVEHGVRPQSEKTLEEGDSIRCYGLNSGVAQWLERLIRRTKDPGREKRMTGTVTGYKETAYKGAMGEMVNVRIVRIIGRYQMIDNIKADEKPHAVEETRHEHRLPINIWAGVLGDRLIGPYVLPQRLTGARYQDFLISVLPFLLDYVPCQQRIQMWFMHDGTTAHFRRNVREHLTLKVDAHWHEPTGTEIYSSPSSAEALTLTARNIPVQSTGSLV
ncbi:hypothetical protein ANN_17267 [Periplaneta americana]|uniref:Uncharacterized protein n=1 Tax=Periplaneta americana TaxID=6978 RepID=A0ABQ8STV5_PERAM|nr:hypothetical protein ANN_17267 [Periplaneta americana]